MVTRMGHMGLRVPDLDAAVDFQREIIGMVETERANGSAYLTCNERHHELVLIQDRVRRGYDHIGLEVPDAEALEDAKRTVSAAGGVVLGGVYDGEPGIDRALRVQGPGRPRVQAVLRDGDRRCRSEPGDRPIKFEHASVKSPQAGRARALPDRRARIPLLGPDGAVRELVALRRRPPRDGGRARAEERAVPLRVRVPRPQRDGPGRRPAEAPATSKLIWGPSRHGPGNNQFIYLLDNDGAMVELCSELAKMPPEGSYRARAMADRPGHDQPVGRAAAARFLLTGFPIASASAASPAASGVV